MPVAGGYSELFASGWIGLKHLYSDTAQISYKSFLCQMASLEQSQQLAGMLNFSAPAKAVPQRPVARATNDRTTQVSPEGIALVVLIMLNNGLDGGSVGFGDFHNGSPSLVRFYFCFRFSLLAIR